MLRLAFATSLVFLWLAGCTPDSYRRSADIQVNKLLEDRKKQTLDYDPQVAAPATMPTQPPKKAYAKVPFTPLPPKTPAPLEPSRLELKYEPLGPHEFFAPGTPAPHYEPMSEAAATAASTNARLLAWRCTMACAPSKDATTSHGIAGVR